MYLHLPTEGLDHYKSASQRARVGTESWGASNFFCPACDSSHLDPAVQGTAAVDYFCPSCDSPFQLKSQSKPIGSKIVDAAYSEMKRAILEDRTPNLYVLHYDLSHWAVQTVILIPHFAFALSAVERRKPLAATACRAGWVGCNIVLDKIPVHARIPVIEEGNIRSRQTVREAYQRLRPLEKLQVEKRGWPSTPTRTAWRDSIRGTGTSKRRFGSSFKSSGTWVLLSFLVPGRIGSPNPGQRISIFDF